MSGRGGKRAGAGRKGHRLSLVQEMRVGAEYAEQLRTLAVDRAWEEYESSVKVRSIREAQDDGGNVDRLILEPEIDKWRAELRKQLRVQLEKPLRNKLRQQGFDQWDIENALNSEIENEIDAHVDAHFEDFSEAYRAKKGGSIRHFVLKPNTYSLRNKAREVAVAFCKDRYGVAISDDKADKCLDAFRCLELGRKPPNV